MAKQAVNIVERHVEKGVLGLCAAILLASIVMFLVSTPNKIAVGGSQVSPAEIDERVRDAGVRLRNTLNNVEPDAAEAKDFVPDLKQASSPIKYAGLNSVIPSPVPPLPRVPNIGEAPPRIGELQLAKAIAPTEPIVTHGRSTVQLSGRADVNWVTLAAKFDQQRQIMESQQAGYKPGRRNPYLVGVDMQRQERLADGSYAEWVDVQTHTPDVLPPLPDVVLEQGRKELLPTDATREAIRNFFATLKEIQVDLFRPLFPERVYGDPWLYPKFNDPEIPPIEELDFELCSKDDPADCVSREYPPQTDIQPVAVAVARTPAEMVDDAIAEARRLLNTGRWDEAIRSADNAKTLDGVRANNLAEFDAIVAEARQRIRDLEQNRIKPPVATDDADDDVTARKSRFQVVWAHDVTVPGLGGAESGKTYRYRVRVRLYNRYCGVPADLMDFNDAKKVFIVGEWSSPTEDVGIPADTEFYFTSADVNNRRKARVTIFKWYEGVWVNHVTDIEVDQPILSKRAVRKAVRENPDGSLDRPNVDFDTGCEVVDIDYDYTFRSKRVRGRGGFEIEPPERTAVLVYKDAEGQLRQKVLSADRGSARYKALKDMEFKPGPARGR